MEISLCQNKSAQIEQFLALSAKTRQQLAGVINKYPAAIGDIEHLKQVSAEQLQNAIVSLQGFSLSLSECAETGVNPWDDRRFLELCLKQLKMTVSQEYLDNLASDDIVEGYTLENIQIFRNMRFMEICGYSLEDVLTFPWPNLYERSTTITDKVLERVREAIETTRVLAANTENHYMKERASSTRQVVEVGFRYIGPLFSSPGKPSGYLISCRAKMLDEMPSRHELRFL